MSVTFKVRSLARPAERRSPRPEGRRSRRQSQSQSQKDHDGGAVPPGVVTELGANGLLRKPRLQVAWVSEGTIRRALFCSATVCSAPSGVPAGPASETEPGQQRRQPLIVACLSSVQLRAGAKSMQANVGRCRGLKSKFSYLFAPSAKTSR